MPKTMPKGISCSRCVSTLPWSPRPARTKQKVEDMYDGCSSALPQYSGITVLKHQEPRYGNVGEDENHGVMAHLFPVLLQKPDSMNWNMKVVLVAPNGSSGHHEGIWGLYIYTMQYIIIYYLCVWGHQASVSCSIAVSVTPHEGHEGTQITSGCTKQLQRTTKAAVGQAKDHDLRDSQMIT